MSKDEDEDRESHESYGMISFSRRQGSPGRLFGSALRSHESYVTMSVRKAERIHDLGSDRYYGSIRGDLIEVDLSAAQFAELLTTMNVGMGVPCTVSHLNGNRVARPPEDVELETEKIRSHFKKDIKKVVELAQSARQEVAEILEKKTLTKVDREAILNKLTAFGRMVSDNAPFMLDQFEEAAEKVVSHAKAEVDAFVTTNIVAAGLRAAMGQAPLTLSAHIEPEKPQLPPADKP